MKNFAKVKAIDSAPGNYGLFVGESTVPISKSLFVNGFVNTQLIINTEYEKKVKPLAQLLTAALSVLHPSAVLLATGKPLSKEIEKALEEFK